jgi:predicted acylesterase/phospholipase RssA
VREFKHQIQVSRVNTCFIAKHFFLNLGCGLFYLFKKTMMSKTHHYVVMGGGAMHGIMYLGVLMEMCCNSEKEYGTWFQGVRCFAGASMGSLLAAMLTLWTPWRCWEYLRTKGLRSLSSTGLFDQTIEDVRRNMSLTSGKLLEKTLREGVADLTGDENTTLLQFYQRTNKRLVITVTNVETGHAEFWCFKTKPKVKLWEALRCSASLPVLFPAYEIDGVKYTDGGVTCNIPCHRYEPSQTLVLFVHAPISTFEEGGNDNILKKLMYHFADSAQLGPMRAEPLFGANAIPCMASKTNVSAYNLGASPDDVDGLVQQGRVCYDSLCVRNVCLAALIASSLFRRGHEKTRVY